MKVKGSFRGRRLLPALGLLLFLLIFLATFAATLSPDIVLSPLRTALRNRGIALEGGTARIALPFSMTISHPLLGTAGGPLVPLDSFRIGWEPTGLLTWLPGHVRMTKGSSAFDLRTSPAAWNPSRVRLRLTDIRSEELSSVLPLGQDVGFAVREADIRWSRSGGSLAGRGTAELDLLRIPIPAAGSPVREAVLRNVSIKLAVRGEDLHVTSLTGIYEDAQVDGTGVIARFLTPSRATITFHLRIVNPLEGRVATLFNMLSKNARNANLRVTGPLLSPAGEFQFF